MKQKEIIVLGSTGSIGKSLVYILKKNKNLFNIKLLSTHKNLKEISKQCKFLNVKNIIVSDFNSYKKAKLIFKRRNIRVLNNFDNLGKYFKKKSDYVMSAISGINGLEPTLKLIRFTKTIAIANKESIICGWNLISKASKKYNTQIIPVDSEHFSIWSLIKDKNINQIDKVYITASGGPFLNKKISQLNDIHIKDALRHPNWSMGKKISIDSATMMNKIFEVIETNRLFNIKLKNIFILIHRDSYLHAIVSFKNGLKTFLVHDTDMKIPIFNTLFTDTKKKFMLKDLDIDKINKLNLMYINSKRFPIIDILKKYPNKNTLFDTVLISINDKLVEKFLNEEINFLQISEYFLKMINLKEFKKYRKLTPKNVNEILKLSQYVSLKIDELSVKAS